MSHSHNKKFDALTVNAGASRIYGESAFATDESSKHNGIGYCTVHTVGIKSAGAATATITFSDDGVTFGNPQTLTLSGAGFTKQPYYAPGSAAVKVAIAGTDCTVTYDAREV